MKKNLVVLMGLLVTGASFAADFDGPLLVHQTTPGFVIPHYRIYTTCKVYSNKVQKIVEIEGVRTEQTTAFNVSVDDLVAKIQAAAKGKITSVTGPTDGPTESYTAIDPAGPTKVVLQTHGDVSKKNEAPEALSLTLLIGQICK